MTLTLLVPGGSPAVISTVTRCFIFTDCNNHCFGRA